MFDREAVKIAEKTIFGELPARRVKFGYALGRVRSNAVMQGALQSSGLLFSVADVCATEIEARADRFWEVLHRAIIATGVEWSPEMADQLKKEFNDLLLRYCFAEIEREFYSTSERLKLSTQASITTGFESRVFGARQTVEAEIELFARSLERRQSVQEHSTRSTVFQIYAPVGAIQTGAGATARVVQNLDGAARQQLTEVLAQIVGDLKEVVEIDAERAGEIGRAIAETRQELERARPSKTMLLAKLQGVASILSAAVQVAPVLRSSYEAFRAILAAHGFPLPG
jgi:hypothetical protein